MGRASLALCERFRAGSLLSSALACAHQILLGRRRRMRLIWLRPKRLLQGIFAELVFCCWLCREEGGRLNLSWEGSTEACDVNTNA